MTEKTDVGVIWSEWSLAFDRAMLYACEFVKKNEGALRERYGSDYLAIRYNEGIIDFSDYGLDVELRVAARNISDRGNLKNLIDDIEKGKRHHDELLPLNYLKKKLEICNSPVVVMTIEGFLNYKGLEDNKT